MYEYEFILILLFFKHFIFDFVLQTKSMILYKGIYGHWYGIKHSLYHGLATILILILFNVQSAIMLGILEFIAHYHIDWIKVKFGSKNISTDRFWIEFGLDQFAHSITYLIIVMYIVRYLT